MRSARRVVAVAALLVALAHASVASASSWALPVSGGTPTLGFGVAYPGGTHRGVDLKAAVGSEVVAPNGGTVTFAGRVPADGGGTCGAVTVELPDGHRISLLPLDDVQVITGDCVTAGDVLGSLAASGDDSSTVPHLHVGLRSGELYLDPAPFLPLGTAVGAGPAPESASVAVPNPPAAASPGATAVVAAAPAPAATAQTPAGASAVVPAEIAESAPAVDTVTPITVSRAVTDADVPVAEAIDPNNAPHTVKPGIRMPLFSARPVTSTVLALGMLATGIAIVKVRRASSVHAR